MSIRFFFTGVKIVLSERKMLKVFIGEMLKIEKRKLISLSIIFCTDEYLLEVNRQYLEHDYYTDIITFDYSEQYKISGDIYIGIETVNSNATLLNSTYQSELKRVIIHGILHLCGFGDKTPVTEKIMHQKEDEALTLLFNQL